MRGGDEGRGRERGRWGGIVRGGDEGRGREGGRWGGTVRGGRGEGGRVMTDEKCTSVKD